MQGTLVNLCYTMENHAIATVITYFGSTDHGLGTEVVRGRRGGGTSSKNRLESPLIYIYIVRLLFTAEDADFIAHTEDLQTLMDFFAWIYTTFGLIISLKKPMLTFTPPPGQSYVEPNIFVKGKGLDVVEKNEKIDDDTQGITAKDDIDRLHMTRKRRKILAKLERCADEVNQELEEYKNKNKDWLISIDNNCSLLPPEKGKNKKKKTRKKQVLLKQEKIERAQRYIHFKIEATSQNQWL